MRRSEQSGSAGPHWALLCQTGEYDYYFVNLCKTSRDFGATRHIVNNCCEDEQFTDAPFERFLDVVEAYAKCNTSKEAAEGETESDIEYNDLREFLPSKSRKRKIDAAAPPSDSSD